MKISVISSWIIPIIFLIDIIEISRLSSKFDSRNLLRKLIIPFFLVVLSLLLLLLLLSLLGLWSLLLWLLLRDSGEGHALAFESHVDILEKRQGVVTTFKAEAPCLNHHQDLCLNLNMTK